LILHPNVPNARVCVVWRAKVETRNTASHVITGIVHYVVSYLDIQGDGNFSHTGSLLIRLGPGFSFAPRPRTV